MIKKLFPHRADGDYKGSKLAAALLAAFAAFAAPPFTPGLSVVHAPPGAVADKVLFPVAIVMACLSLRGPKPNGNAVSS